MANQAENITGSIAIDSQVISRVENPIEDQLYEVVNALVIQYLNELHEH